MFFVCERERERVRVHLRGSERCGNLYTRNLRDGSRVLKRIEQVFAFRVPPRESAKDTSTFGFVKSERRRYLIVGRIFATPSRGEFCRARMICVSTHTPPSIYANHAYNKYIGENMG